MASPPAPIVITYIMEFAHLVFGYGAHRVKQTSTKLLYQGFDVTFAVSLHSTPIIYRRPEPHASFVHVAVQKVVTGEALKWRAHHSSSGAVPLPHGCGGAPEMALVL